MYVSSYVDRKKLLLRYTTISSSCSWCNVIKRVINQPLANTKRHWHSKTCNAKRGWFARQILSCRIQFMQLTTKCSHEGQCMAHSSACLSHSVVPGAVAGTYHVQYIPLLAQNISSKLPPPFHTYTDHNALIVTLRTSFTLSWPLFLNLLNMAVYWRITQSPQGTPHNI